MKSIVYWFRSDLRLGDNPALAHACEVADEIVPVVVLPKPEVTRWQFERQGLKRRSWWRAAVNQLSSSLRAHGCELYVLEGQPSDVLGALCERLGDCEIHCEEIPAPEEDADVAALRARGLTVRTTWQSTLINIEDLPFPVNTLPDVFTPFRQAIERGGVQPRPSIPIPVVVRFPGKARHNVPESADSPCDEAFATAGEPGAQKKLRDYFGAMHAHQYKRTRDSLAGDNTSTGFSPWLATGALSPRQLFEALKGFEMTHGANEGTYWIWFELLWRDYFRFLHRKYGRALYRWRGLADRPLRSPASIHDASAFGRWCRGQTGVALVDAGMNELVATGHVSNRMRQILASYCIHDLGCDWRAGAAWFEHHLKDYDVTSNTGNWLYIAGLGTDPRGGRRFDPEVQCARFDPDGVYRRRWGRN